VRSTTAASVVAAAGNTGLTGESGDRPSGAPPPPIPHVLDGRCEPIRNDAPATFSTIAPTLDVAAPGRPRRCGAVSHDASGYSVGLDATSFAAPIVSARAAWVWTWRPTLDVTQIVRPDAPDRARVGRRASEIATGFGIVHIRLRCRRRPLPPDPSERTTMFSTRSAPARCFPDGGPGYQT